jgi:hypothetical protein
MTQIKPPPKKSGRFILLRDYARGILEYAFHIGVLSPEIALEQFRLDFPDFTRHFRASESTPVQI